MHIDSKMVVDSFSTGGNSLLYDGFAQLSLWRCVKLDQRCEIPTNPEW